MAKLLGIGAVSLGLLVGSAGVGVGTYAATPAAAAARECPGASARDVGDIDGDGVADPVVVTFGPPGGGPSYLDVHNSAAAEQVIGAADVGVTGVASLGYATLVVDVNADGCADVVTLGNGAVFIIPGSPDGLVPTASRRLSSPEVDGGWGASIAILDNPRVLAVGASYSKKSPRQGGAVYLYPLADDGTAGSPTVVHQDTAGVPGKSESIDDFGQELAADGNLLAIAAPFEKNGSKRLSGAVTLLKFTGRGLGFTALRWTQDSPGFATRAETGDMFGSALAVRGNYVAIGAPYEGLGKAKEAGIVHVVKLSSATKPTVSAVYDFHQGSPKIPGRSETNDHWGGAVALAANVGCTPMSVVIGTPGEKVGKPKERSGSVTLVGLGRTCANQWLPSASFGIPFRYFGRRIVTLASAAGGTTPDTVVIGDAFSRALGNDVYETGQVITVKTTGVGRWSAQRLPPRDGYHAYNNYGQALGVANHG